MVLSLFIFTESSCSFKGSQSISDTWWCHKGKGATCSNSRFYVFWKVQCWRFTYRARSSIIWWKWPRGISYSKKENHWSDIEFHGEELQCIIDSLDRKFDRRRGDRTKVMCLYFTIGSDSTRPMPESVPEWAKELFS